MKTEPAVAAYLAQAQSWDEDRYLLLARSNRRAWQVAGTAVIVATLATAAMAVLTPLKTVVPYVIRVDNSTGIVDVVPTYTGTAPPVETVTRYLISHYVSARERYVAALAESDYELVGSFNSAPMNQAWFAAWDPRNAESPLNRYKDGTTVLAQIQAVSFLTRRSGERDVAQVRLLTATRPGGTGAEQVQRWIITLTYAYAGPAKDNRQRSLNPLGLRVTEYRKEPEVAAAVSAPSVS